MKISEVILTELVEIAPGLKNLDVGGGGIPYTVPTGFFDDFERILMNRINFENASFFEPDSYQETAGISPILHNQAGSRS